MENWILCIVMFVLVIAIAIIDYILYRKRRFEDEMVHDNSLVNKWVLLLDNDMLVRVRGDFWVGYNAKENKPYSLNCGKGSLGHYKSEERCKEILTELSEFLNDKEWTVFIMP